ncbi:MAG: hypothetical protein ACUVXJ_18680 [Phycisphaerae bacterium]
MSNRLNLFTRELHGRVEGIIKSQFDALPCGDGLPAAAMMVSWRRYLQPLVQRADAGDTKG